MSKKLSIIVLVCLALVGSFVSFYATNLFMFDVGMKLNMFAELSPISTLPLFMIAITLVIGAMFILKLQKYPNSKKQLVKIYSLIIAVLAFVGFITSILSGTIIYGSLVAKYPFPGYCLICLIVNALVLIAALLVRFYFVKKLPDDTETNKIKVSTVFKALGLQFVIYYAFERFGAVMWSPVYAQARTLYMTWIFYVYLLVPMATGIYLALNYFGKGAKDSKFTRIYILPVIAVHVIFGALTLVLGATNTLFVSAVSNAIGLERLASMPIVILLTIVGYTAFFVVQIVKAIRFKKSK